MAATMNLTLLVVALIAAATVLPGTQAAQYVVGDTTGWNPSGGATFYTSWAAKHNFSVGDILGELAPLHIQKPIFHHFSMASLFVELYREKSYLAPKFSYDWDLVIEFSISRIRSLNFVQILN
jgi:hypothetical protein